MGAKEQAIEKKLSAIEPLGLLLNQLLPNSKKTTLEREKECVNLAVKLYDAGYCIPPELPQEKELRENIAKLPNPYFIVERVGMDTETSYNQYPEFEVFEEARRAILSLIKSSPAELKVLSDEGIKSLSAKLGWDINPTELKLIISLLQSQVADIYRQLGITKEEKK